ncbi:PEP/pyruvate-binding domain-containing protein [Desulfobulbus sp.]|uniref:PEP/pyruvate-binding domain-containing protein n=1 Tax=Desulfobulbus sp. TaxID=895 RepID=UPI00286EF178|nr:PEP/pyruvate-binding domain-containing protein [Desulfobulbus sp.]
MPLPDRISTLLRRLLRPGTAATKPDPDQAARKFAARARSFHDLLAARAGALKAMAELDAARRDGRPLSISFIRARCTLATVNVFKIIRHCNQIVDGHHEEPERTFSRLRQRIETILEARREPVAGETLLDLVRIDRTRAGLAGEKMAHLAEAGAIGGIRIPPGFVFTAAATGLFFQHNQLYRHINHILQQIEIADLEDLYRKSAAIRELIRNAPMPPELETQLLDRFDRLADAGTACRVAVRSSAVAEGIGPTAFAELYRSELDVGRDDLIDACKTVLASKYTPQAISHRLAKGLLHEQCEMAIGVLAMVEARVSGVCHTRSIGGPEDTLDLFYAPGMAKGIVDGTRSIGYLRLERQAPHRIVARQEAGDAIEPWLADAEAVALAEIGMRLERHFGAPREIEWSIDPAGALFVLQSRPAGTVQAPAGPTPTPAAGRPLPLLHGGVTGCDGAGCGEVFVVRTVPEALRCPRRAVLVVRHPLPEWAPLLHRAVALVAETGSEACYLAILAREFGLPALVALDRATELLADGALVTVDATARAVYQGRIDSRPGQTVDRPDPQEGSPVRRILTEVLSLVGPLDPPVSDSPGFQADRCQTLDDLIRLYHQQAVAGIFAFSRRVGNGQGAAKRLGGALPGQWWVVDLGGALIPDYDRSRPDLEITDIANPLLHAFWTGMRHSPRQKPSASGLRAAAAALFLASGGNGPASIRASFLRQKNYFLLSQKYCNLNICFGRLFATVEAMLDDRDNDSSIAFRCTVGTSRQTRRIEILAEVLEHFGFRTERDGEVLAARVDRESGPVVFDRLKVLGSLVVCARQLAAEPAGRDTCIQAIEEMLHHE